MEMILVVLQVALAGMLGVAAVGKFLDLPGSRQAVTDFGVPARLAHPLGTALPVAELVLAMAVLPAVTARWAALGAMLLFLAFIAGIGVNIRQGRHPECHCFGQFHSAPAGWPTIVRNAAFTLVAAIIAWQGSPGPVSWFAGLSELSQIVVVLGVAALALLAVQAWLSYQVVQQNRILLDDLEEDRDDQHPGTASGGSVPSPVQARSAAPFDLPTVDGQRVTLRTLLSTGRSSLLLFVAPGCGPCRHLIPDIHEWHHRFADEMNIVLISRGSEEENLEKFGDLTVALQQSREVVDLYGIEGTPTAVLVERDGSIREPSARGRARIRALVMRAMSAAEAAPASSSPRTPRSAPAPRPIPRLHESTEIGTAIPRLPLPDLHGGFLGLDDLLGEQVVLLFFNPDCAFCRRMLPELRQWEAEAGDGIRHALIISGGSIEANRELDLRTRLVIDDGFTLGTAFGVTGTPAALLIGADGTTASPVLPGADAVLDLLYAQIPDTTRLTSAP